MIRLLVWVLCALAMVIGLFAYVIFHSCDWVISWGDDVLRRKAEGSTP